MFPLDVPIAGRLAAVNPTARDRGFGGFDVWREIYGRRHSLETEMSTNPYRLARPGFRLRSVAILAGFLMVNPATGRAQQGTASELLQQAQVFEDNNNLDAAEGIYRKILASEPANAEAWKRLGNLQQAERKFDDSISSFKQVLARHPAYEDVNFLLGLSYYGKNDMDDAIDSFNRELKTPTADLATRYYLALVLESKGRMDEAITQLQLSAKQNPTKSKVFYELARLYLNATYRSIEQLKRIDPDSYELHALMGEFYSQGGSFELAAANYRAALKKNPEAQGIHTPLGIAYWMISQFDNAEKEFLLALQESPDDAYANFYLGRIAVHDHKYSEARPYLEKVVSTHVEELETRVLLGRCYIGLGEWQEAKADLEAAVGLAPSDPRSHFMLAQIYEKLNQPVDRQRELDLYDKFTNLQRPKAADGDMVTPNPQPETKQ
jgi:tetratricopeptide (TPR) repeat protein